MKFYHKYKDALEAKGYRVDEHGYLINLVKIIK